MLTDYPMLAVACFCAAVIVLAALSILLFSLAQRPGRGYANTVPLSVLKKWFHKKRTSCPWAMIYINISMYKTKNGHSCEDAEKLYEYIRREVLLLAYRTTQSRVAYIDDRNFLILTSVSIRRFEEACLTFLKSVETCASRNSIVYLPEIHIGYCVAEGSDTPFEEIVLRARQTSKYAQYVSRKYCVCSYDLLKDFEEIEQLEKTIDAAIENNNFYMEFQPFINLSDGSLAGCEMLSRLNHATRGHVSPNKFLSAVAENGLYEKFDNYVFEKCCEWFSCRVGTAREVRLVSCNFTRVSVSHEGFAERVTAIADRYGVPHASVALELTEEDAASDTARVREELVKLAEQGFHIYLDDFGKGYTSYSDLQNYPVDVLKIDRDLLNNAASEKGRVIFLSVVSLAKKLGIRVLCEGIETEEQAKFAADAGCDIAQGYYYDKPLSVEEMDALSKKSRTCEPVYGVNTCKKNGG